jgi:hypothetical protein
VSKHEKLALFAGALLWIGLFLVWIRVSATQGEWEHRCIDAGGAVLHRAPYRLECYHPRGTP